MALTVTIQYKALRTKLDKLQRKVTPVGRDGYIVLLAGSIYPFLQGAAKTRFRTESDAEGKKWAPLLPSTQSFRRSLHYGAKGPINRRTDDLMSMMLDGAPQITPLTGGDLALVYPGNAQSKGNRPTKVAQAQGFLRQRNGKLSTARPVIDLGPTDYLQVVGLAARFFGEGLGRD